MKCYGCNEVMKNLKVLREHLKTSQDCVDKIEEERLNNPNVKYANPIFDRAESRKGVRY